MNTSQFLTRLLIDLILCGSYVGDHSCYEFLSTLSFPKDTISAQSSQLPDHYHLSASSSATALNLAWKECNIDASLIVPQICILSTSMSC